MKTVRINSRNSLVSGSIVATPNRFLNYAEIVADAKKRIEMEKAYQAERIITLSNSSGKQPVYMLIQSTVIVAFEIFNSEMGFSRLIPKIKEITDRKVKFYCLDKNKQPEEVNPTFRYNGKTLNYEELTQVGNFKEGFIYDDCELGIAVHRSVCSRNKDYAASVTPFAKMVFS